jgi:hypothetical protein
MKLHEQLTSPQLSNQLHKLGLIKPSVFWRDYTGSRPEELEWANGFEPYYCEDNVNAYSAVDLGEMLPSRLYNTNDKEHGEHQFICEKWPNGLWNAAYVCLKCKGNLVKFQDENEADARAKMLISLIENNLIKLNQ